MEKYFFNFSKQLSTSKNNRSILPQKVSPRLSPPPPPSHSHFFISHSFVGTFAPQHEKRHHLGDGAHILCEVLILGHGEVA